MARRFTEDSKWSDSWFRALRPEFKLAWGYLTDNCDISGVLDLDQELANFQIGVPVDWAGFFSECGHRVVVLDRGKVWVKGFILFQQRTTDLNEANRCHLGILQRLERHGLKKAYFQAFPKGHRRGLQAPKNALPRALGNSKGNGKCLKEGGTGETKPAMNFKSVPPSLSDVRTRIADRGLRIDAEKFIAYYEVRGWRTTSGPVRNWDACLTTWSKSEFNDAPKPTGKASYSREDSETKFTKYASSEFKRRRDAGLPEPTDDELRHEFNKHLNAIAHQS